MHIEFLVIRRMAILDYCISYPSMAGLTDAAMLVTTNLILISVLLIIRKPHRFKGSKLHFVFTMNNMSRPLINEKRQRSQT